MGSKRRIAYLVLAFGWFAISGYALMGVRASIITDIPQQLNNALFDGNSIFAARTILTAGILTSVGMVLAALRLPYGGVFIVLLSVLGALTAIGWAEPTLLIAAVFITVGLFGKQMVETIRGRGAEGG